MNKTAAKGLPGSEKILKDWKKTGPNTAKVPQKPKEDPKFSQGTEKKKKTVKESINISTNNMIDKFDKLFEDVMNDDDLQELGIDNDSATGEGDVEFTEEPGVGENPADKIRSVIAQLEDILVAMGEPTEDDMEAEGESHDEIEGGDPFGGGDDALKEESVEAEFKGTPLVNQKKSELDNPHGNSSNKVNSPGTKVSGAGKADGGKIPEPQADPKAVGDKSGVLQKKDNKVSSKIKGNNQSLFHV